MAWITNDGASTINLSHSSGAASIFRLKELLKTAGWTVLSSSDGTTYNASGDQITHVSSGAGGMNNNYAWFRIEDPGSLREYVFQRSTDDYQWKWHYSADDGFTGGAPDAVTIPTAPDMKGVAKGSTNFTTLFPTSGSWYTHIAAQNAEENDVYAWWLVTYVSDETTMLACEAIDSDSTSNDSDPCLHIGTDTTPAYNLLSSSNPVGNAAVGWMLYGEDGEEWGGLSGLYYQMVSFMYQPVSSSDSVAIDPHDDLIKPLPIHWTRFTSAGGVPGYKGMGKYFRWNPRNATYLYSDLVQVGLDYWLVWQDVLLPGWPDSTTPST